MTTQNLHMHSAWDDGKNTAEEMILASMAAGLTSVGISLHAPMGFETDWAPDVSVIPAYQKEVRALGEKYADSIRVYCGVEWDTLSPVDPAEFDYAIGSVHNLPVEGMDKSQYPPVDASAGITQKLISAYFDGDCDAAAKRYFEQYALVAAQPHVQIVGHFDLITKFDERHHFFRPESPVYKKAAREAMEALVASGKIFEINTGAISRGYRTTPYPAPELLRQLHAMNGRVTITADAHHADGVVCAFDQAEQLARACGFEEIWILEGKEFIPLKI